MKMLAANQRAQVIGLLCEGQSVRSIVRVTGISKNTILKLLADVGAVCASYQDAVLRDLHKTFRVQCDEIWAFTYAKQKNVLKAKAAPDWAGDTWTWVALDADNKLVINWLVGGRDSEFATAFMCDLADRLPNRVQLTTDGHPAYAPAVEEAFAGRLDYGVINKIYGTSPESAKGRYSPAEVIAAKKERVEGYPDPKHISTSYVERQNLTMRMHMRRFTRLTNGFSKRVESHMNAVSLHFFFYNFVKIHASLRVTPAMAAGVTDRLWDITDIVKLLEEQEAKKPRARGPYKKKVATPMLSD